MDRVSRTHGTKQVLKDISLSYFYGAKIGVIGSNGSGKSSLLRIMAGRDTDYTGEVSSSPGYTIGYLEQEPQLQSGKTVREVVSEGVQELVDLLAEFDAVNEAFADPNADMDKLMEKQAKIQERLDATDAWNLDSRLDLAMEALRCPPAEQTVDVLSGGESAASPYAAFYFKSPTFFYWTSRQTTSTLKRSHGLSGTCTNMQAQLSVLRTTGTFWIMLQAGF